MRVPVIIFLIHRQDSRFCDPLLSSLQMRWAVFLHRRVSDVCSCIWSTWSLSSGILHKCVEHIEISFWFGFVGLFVSITRPPIVFSVRVSSRIVDNRRRFCSRNRISPASLSVVLTDHILRRRRSNFQSSNNSSMVSSTSVSGTRILLEGSGWSGFLLSDRDNRNCAAHEAFLPFPNFGFPPGCLE